MVNQFPPDALLYRWNFQEDDARPRLIGTDPTIGRDQFFRWVNEPGGWDRREPWPQGAANAEKIGNAAAAVSGWPGASAGRGRGRPKKELAEDDRPISVSASVRRAELFEIQQLASASKKSVSEWIASAIRSQLAVVGAAEAGAAGSDTPPEETGP